MKILFFAILFFISAVGCTTIKTQTAKVQTLLALKDVAEKSKYCKMPIKSNPKYAHLLEKLNLMDFNSSPTETQLADTETPNDSDIETGLSYWSEMQYCIDKSIEDTTKIDPYMGVFLSKILAKQANLVNEIIVSRPSYGHINKEIVNFKDDTKKDLRKFSTEFDKRYKIMEEQEQIEARNDTVASIGKGLGIMAAVTAKVVLDAVNALAEAQIELAKSQAIYAASHPTYIIAQNPIRTTRCNWVRNSLSCNTF